MKISIAGVLLFFEKTRFHHFFNLFYEIFIFRDFFNIWSSYFGRSKLNGSFHMTITLLKESEAVWATITATETSSYFRCRFCDHLSYLAYRFLFTQRIARHFTYIVTWAIYQCIREKYGELIWIREFWVMIKNVMRFSKIDEFLKD